MADTIAQQPPKNPTMSLLGISLPYLPGGLSKAYDLTRKKPSGRFVGCPEISNARTRIARRRPSAHLLMVEPRKLSAAQIEKANCR